MRVALAQLEPRAGALEHNRELATEAIASAAADGADLVMLPELFTVGYFAFDAYEDAAESFQGPTVEHLGAAARHHDVAVLAGSFLEDLSLSETVDRPRSTGLANTSVLLDRSGGVLAHYRKRHLFGYESEEADRLVPGTTLGIADLGGHTVGITTCFDLRFPDLYTDYLAEGVTLMLVPSAWPSPRPEHWATLTRARAIENQWYLAAVNSAGSMAGVELLGRSVLYDPWGDPVTTLEADPGIAIGETDSDRVDRIRRGFPVLDERFRD